MPTSSSTPSRQEPTGRWGTRFRGLVASSTIVVAVLATAPGIAQYQAAGTGVQLPPQRKQQLQGNMEAAPWNLGAIRVAPWIGIRNLAYQKDILGEKGNDDVIGTAGAGLRFYLPFGDTGMLSAHAIPEYSFYLDNSDRNRATGRYGLGYFAFFNRFELELTARQREDLAFPTNELLVRVPQEETILETQGQIRVWSSIAVFGSASRRELRYDSSDLADQGPIEQRLDRDEETYRAGLRYLFRADSGWIGFGVQEEESLFELDPDRSNQGTSYFVNLLLRGNKIDLHLDWVERDLEAVGDGAFPATQETTGGFLVRLRPGWRLEPEVYGARRLTYSLTNSPFFIETRYGLAARATLYSRIQLRAFLETGEDSYDEAAVSQRVDDVDAWGIVLDYRPFEVLSLQLGYRETDYKSNMPGFDRTLEEVVAGITLRFGTGIGFGEPGNEW